MPTNKMNFLQVIKKDMSEVNNRGVVKVNYKALNKLVEEHERLSNHHGDIEGNEDFTIEDEGIEFYGNETLTVNYMALAELVDRYERLLEFIMIRNVHISQLKIRLKSP